MRRLTPLSRRSFSQGLGASLVLASAPKRVTAQDGAHVVTVRMSRFAFVPANVKIRAGDTVVWTNEDLAPHTATARDGRWDTGALETAMTRRVSFTAPGDFEFFCAFHPHMVGTVSVRPSDGG